MTDIWDGRPENPERAAWHWLRRADDGRCVCSPWSADQSGWVDGVTLSPATVVEYGVSYLGPCLTPAEVEAREAAARREGIEAAWGVVADEPVPEGKLTFHEVMQRDERMMERIRALLEDK